MFADLKSEIEHLSAKALFRQLEVKSDGIDFASNDYLGIARNKEIAASIATLWSELINQSNGEQFILGASGSRLVSGESFLYAQLEKKISEYHDVESALLFNSGYHLNVGLFAALAKPGDTIVYDEQCHASLIQGIKLSGVTTRRFRHNNLNHLRQKLIKSDVNSQAQIYVVIESIYSMEGSAAPLREILEIVEEFGARLIIDEAHALGVVGRKGAGLVSHLGLQDRVFARVVTYGKAFGLAGAALLGPELLKKIMINKSKPFIYTTALPIVQLIGLIQIYDYMLTNIEVLQKKLNENIEFFRKQMSTKLAGRQIDEVPELLPSEHPIQVLIYGNSQAVLEQSQNLKSKGFTVAAMRPPTVPKGTDRLRICLHVHNTKQQIQQLVEHIKI
ncbi:MAG: 8-amino-7-oxononanoate synthase [Oligoflexales bacterium]|nr:8-amino-7-oxononanoate synthase [Oligoflexales bacterium]